MPHRPRPSALGQTRRERTVNYRRFLGTLSAPVAGFGSANAAIFATIGVGIVNVLATLVAVWLIDRVGRRSRLLVGEAGMMANLAVLGAGFL